MNIYTSYYSAMASRYEDYAIVSISTSVPKWFPVRMLRMKELVPPWEIVEGIHNGEITEEEYTRVYKEQLSKLDRDLILKELDAISTINDNKDVVLCCYEAPNKFCHRKLVAKWLDCDVTELRT